MWQFWIQKNIQSIKKHHFLTQKKRLGIFVIKVRLLRKEDMINLLQHSTVWDHFVKADMKTLFFVFLEYTVIHVSNIWLGEAYLSQIWKPTILDIKCSSGFSCFLCFALYLWLYFQQCALFENSHKDGKDWIFIHRHFTGGGVFLGNSTLILFLGSGVQLIIMKI